MTLSAASYPVPAYAGSRRLTSSTTLTVAAAMGYFVVDSTAGIVVVVLPLAGSLAIGATVEFSFFTANINGCGIQVQTGNTLQGAAAPGTASFTIVNDGALCLVTGPTSWEVVKYG